MNQAVAERKSLPRNVKVLGGASLLNDIASEMIFPLLPVFLSALGGSKVVLGLIEGLADSISSFVKLWSGGWSDKAGRRKGFVVFGYSLPALTRPIIGLVTAPWQLFGLRIFDRIGKGIRTSPRDAMIADSTSAEMRGRAFGFHRAMDHAGAAIGPLLATTFLWVWPEEMRTLFMLAIVPGLLVVALVIFGLRETPTPAKHEERLRLTLQPFDRRFRLYLLALLVFTLGNATDAFLLVRAHELGVPTEFLPALWGIFHIAKSASNYFLGRGVDRIGPRPFIFGGWLLYAGVSLAFAFASTPWEAWLFFLVYALFYGLTEPAEKTLVASLVGSEHKGLAFGWFNFAIGVATLPASLIFGAIYEWWGPLAAFGWSAALAAVAALMLAGVRPPRRIAE
jgi:MFS family permease